MGGTRSDHYSSRAQPQLLAGILKNKGKQRDSVEKRKLAILMREVDVTVVEDYEGNTLE